MTPAELHKTAKELGCTIKKGSTKFAGYVLKLPDGEYPVGVDYSASLDDLADALEAYAADVSAGGLSLRR